MFDYVTSDMARLSECVFVREVSAFLGVVKSAVSIHDCTADIEASVG